MPSVFRFFDHSPAIPKNDEQAILRVSRTRLNMQSSYAALDRRDGFKEAEVA
jgi:hypothetical protein